MAQFKEYDLIVVGAGTGGLIAAARIAEKMDSPHPGCFGQIILVGYKKI